MSIESEKNQLSEVVSNNDYNWVIYFDSKCGNCKEILKEVNEVGEGVKVILLTIEDTDTIKDLVNQIESRNVDAYQVSAKDIFKSFGSLRTPQVYLINKESKILEFKKVFEI
jgi:thioredoxin-related protein